MENLRLNNFLAYFMIKNKTITGRQAMDKALKNKLKFLYWN